MPEQALLVMESRGVTPGTRSFQFSDAWNRLYQVGEYFVDLMYQPGDNAKLHGQVIRSDGKTESFTGEVSLDVDSQSLSGDGQFDLAVKAEGEHSLKINLNSKVVEVNGLSFLKATMW